MVIKFLYAIVFTIFEVLSNNYSNLLKLPKMKKLSYLKLAKEVQEIYWEKRALGKYNDTDIYYLFVVGVVPVCINVYRDMIKVDVSDYNRLAEENRLRKLEIYQKLLKRRSRKRLK